MAGTDMCPRGLVRGHVGAKEKFRERKVMSMLKYVSSARKRRARRRCRGGICLPLAVVAAVFLVVGCLAGFSGDVLASETPADAVYPCNTNIQTAVGVGDVTAAVVDRYGQVRRPEWRIDISMGQEKRSVRRWRPSQSLRKGYLPVVQTEFPREAGGLSMTCFSSDWGGGAADYLRLKTGDQPVHLLLTPITGRPQVKDNKIIVGDTVVAILTPPQKVTPAQPNQGLISEGTTAIEEWGSPRIPCDLSFRNIRVGWEGRAIRYVFPASLKKPSYVYVGFIESHWTEPGKRVLDIAVTGQKKTLDPIEDAAKDEPVIISFVVEKAKEIEIEVVASGDSADKNSTLAAIWILDEKVDLQDLQLGRLNRRARFYVDCGSLNEKIMRPGLLISYAKGQEAWLKLPIQGQPTGQERIDREIGEAALSAAEEKWEGFLSAGAKIVLPDEKLNNLYKTSLINLMLLRLHLPQESPDEDIYVVRPGVTAYADFWYRDGAYICRLLDMAGYHDEAEKSLRLFWRSKGLLGGNNAWLQAPNGCWNYPVDQWDGQGQAPWALMSHFRFTRDEDWLEKVYPSLRASAHWIKAATAKTKWSAEEPRPITWGLFPSGRGDAIGEGYIYYHNFWGVLGIKEIAGAAGILGKKDDLEWMGDVHRQFRSDLMRSVKMAFQTTGKKAFIPGDPFSYSLRIWGSLAAAYPCGILDPSDPMVTATLSTMWRRMETASPGEDEYIFVTNPKLWTYITTDWAMCYLLRGEPKKFWRLFNGYVRHASPTNGWTEEISLDSRLGTGDMPHGWGAAGYVLLVRNAVALERKDTLHIASGIQPEWLMRGPVEVQGLPTEFGKINLSIRHTAKGKPLSVILKIKKFADRPGKVPVVVHVPREGEWDGQKVLLNGNVLAVRHGAGRCEL